MLLYLLMGCWLRLPLRLMSDAGRVEPEPGGQGLWLWGEELWLLLDVTPLQQLLSNPKTTAERKNDIFKPLTSKVKAFLQWMCRLFKIFLISFSCITGNSRNQQIKHFIRLHPGDLNTCYKKSLSLAFWIRHIIFSGSEDGSCEGARHPSSCSSSCSELHMFGADDSADEDLVLTSKPVTI